MPERGEAIRVERVVNVAGEIGADGLGRNVEARSPLGDELLDMGEAVVARGVEIGDELLGGHASKGLRPHGPDRCDPREAGVTAPEGGEVQPEERGRAGSFDDCSVLAREERRVADEEGSVGVGQHGEWIGGLLASFGMRAEEVAKEDLGVGLRTARGGVGGQGAYAAEGGGFVQAEGIFDEQEDAADFVQRGDGAAGNDRELGRKCGDGDQSQIGCTRVELGCAVCGRGVVRRVAGGELGCAGCVFEVVQKGGGIEESDGGDAKHNIKGTGVIV